MVHSNGMADCTGTLLSADLQTISWKVTPLNSGVCVDRTSPAIFARPLSQADARANLDSLLALPHVQAVGEDDRFWDRFREVADDVRPTGNLVPDAHIVALMLSHGIRTIWTRDRDYRSFSGIRVRDPF